MSLLTMSGQESAGCEDRQYSNDPGGKEEIFEATVSPCLSHSYGYDDLPCFSSSFDEKTGENSTETGGQDRDEESSLKNHQEEMDMCAVELEDDDTFIYTRPIVVGYAFGPKKMSTMGVVMAEASKTKLSRTATVLPHFSREQHCSQSFGKEKSASATALSHVEPLLGKQPRPIQTEENDNLEDISFSSHKGEDMTGEEDGALECSEVTYRLNETIRPSGGLTEAAAFGDHTRAADGSNFESPEARCDACERQDALSSLADAALEYKSDRRLTTAMLTSHDRKGHNEGCQQGLSTNAAGSGSTEFKDAESAIHQGGLQCSVKQGAQEPMACRHLTTTHAASAASAPETIVFTIDSSHNITLSSSSAQPNAPAEAAGLRNIVRYFRSSCSSIADSASTGTCTASTTTTFGSNSCYHFAPTASTTAASTQASFSSHGKNYQRSEGGVHSNRQQLPLRVAFVPLDPDMPLEEQHGGKMDIILHKLTEDILCLSQLATDQTVRLKNSQVEKETARDLDNSVSSRFLKSLFLNENDEDFEKRKPKRSSNDAFLDTSKVSPGDLAAIRRVHRLTQFQKEHPECCLVDNPLAVQTLMSRSDIANTLKQCLKGVRSTSGIPVSSPRFCVIGRPVDSDEVDSRNRHVSNVMKDMEQAGLCFPVIAKPLTAAGTKASHAMAILIDPEGLERLVTDKDLPCLCQEYCNHDAILYKVYVLGDHVSVHRRRSLPNLPTLTASRTGRKLNSYVEFDSQRPYPRLSDFGFQDEAADEKDTEDPRGSGPQHQGVGAIPTPKLRRQQQGDAGQPYVLPKSTIVTDDEVRPIVDALKRAFGLELFGFDILIRSKSRQRQHDPGPNDKDEDHGKLPTDQEQDGCNPSRQQHQQQQMLVVDVNYFPSYKEVPHFPALLAKYLTDRAIESRRRSYQRRAAMAADNASSMPCGTNN